MSYQDLGFNQFLQREVSAGLLSSSGQLDPSQFDLLTTGQEIDASRIINDKRFILMDSIVNSDLRDTESGSFKDVPSCQLTFSLPNQAQVKVHYNVNFVLYGMVTGWDVAANYQLSIDDILIDYPQRYTDVKEYDGTFNGNFTRRACLSHHLQQTLTKGEHTISLQNYITRNNSEVLRTIISAVGYIAINSE